MLLITAVPFLACGTVYYVRTDGSDGNSGTANTIAGAWLTLGHAGDSVTAGDIVRIQAGTYNEKPTISCVGTAEAPIFLVADGQVICRGFTVDNASYISFIGLEVTHTNLSIERGFTLGTCDHIQIIDCYFHNIFGRSIYGKSGDTASYLTFRGNRFASNSIIPGVWSNSYYSQVSMPLPTVDQEFVNHVLCEYNTASHVGDFSCCWGSNVIVRNNYFNTFDEADYTNAPGFNHVDFDQAGSGNDQHGSRQRVVENNLCLHNPYSDSHFLIANDGDTGDSSVVFGDTNILVRGNVAADLGGAMVMSGGCSAVMAYNNTTHFCDVQWHNTIYTFAPLKSGWPLPTNALVVNNIISEMQDAGTPIYVNVAGTVTTNNNLGYLAGTSPSFVSTANPLFVNTNTYDLRLSAGSPAIGLGTNVVWITSENGTGTSFDVNNGFLLCDGYGIADGDTITLAGGSTVTITGISGNTVTVGSSVTWTNLEPVYWGKYARADIGALPYGCTPLVSASIGNSGSTYTVTTSGDTRGVWFYTNGIPAIWDSTPPFTATIASGIVTAKAYALYAQADPVVTATQEAPKQRFQWKAATP